MCSGDIIHDLRYSTVSWGREADFLVALEPFEGRLAALLLEFFCARRLGRSSADADDMAWNYDGIET